MRKSSLPSNYRKEKSMWQPGVPKHRKIIIISIIVTVGLVLFGATFGPLFLPLVTNHFENRGISQAITAQLNNYINTCPAPPDWSTVDTTSFHPYITGKVVVVDFTSKKIADANSDDSLNAIRAYDPQEVGTIICLYFRHETIGVYDNGPLGVEQDCDIVVLDKAKNTIVGETTIGGGLPPQSTSRSDTDTSGSPVGQGYITSYILDLPVQ